MSSLAGLGGGVWRWWNLNTERPGGKKLGQGTFNPSTQELSKRMSSETEQAMVMYAWVWSARGPKAAVLRSSLLEASNECQNRVLLFPLPYLLTEQTFAWRPLSITWRKSEEESGHLDAWTPRHLGESEPAGLTSCNGQASIPGKEQGRGWPGGWKWCREPRADKTSSIHSCQGPPHR